MKMKKIIKKYSANLLIVIFTLLVFFLFLEIALQFNISIKNNKEHINSEFDESPIRIGNINEDSLVLDTLKPNSSMNLAGAYVKINSLGFRDYEYSLEKPNNTFRIAVLGDSFTFGYGVEIDETYVKQLEILLNKNFDKKIEVLNFGGNGGNTLLESIYLKEKVLEFDPDLIIVGFTPNDVDVEYISDKEFCIKNSEELSENSEFLTKTESYKFITDKYNSIKTKYDFNKKIIAHENFVDDNPNIDVNYYFFSIYEDNYPGFNCFNEGVKRFVDISNKEDLEILFILIPYDIYPDIMEMIISKISFTLEHYNISYYNLFPYFKKYFSNPSFDLDTKIGAPHYNKLGNEIIANATFELLIKDNIIHFN